MYFVIGPSEIDNKFLFFAPIEGIAYTIVVLLAHEKISKALSAVVIAVAALLNYLVVQFWWVFAVIPTTLGSDSLPSPLNSIVMFSFHSAAGALFYVLLLDWLIQPKYFSLRTYILAMLFTSIAGIPLALETSFNVETHKLLWWTGFSFALITSYRLHQKLNANKRMQPGHSKAKSFRGG